MTRPRGGRFPPMGTAPLHQCWWVQDSHTFTPFQIISLYIVLYHIHGTYQAGVIRGKLSACTFLDLWSDNAEHRWPVGYGLREKSRRATVGSAYTWVKAYQDSARFAATSASCPNGPTSPGPDDDGVGGEVYRRLAHPAPVSMARHLL